MSSRKRDWGRKVTQVVWEDLRPWIEQLWAGHGILVSFRIHILADATGLRSGVVLEVHKKGKVLTDPFYNGRYETFDTEVCGAAAACGVRLASRLLLDLDERAASGATPMDDLPL